jgi:hypothetical protein
MASEPQSVREHWSKNQPRCRILGTPVDEDSSGMRGAAVNGGGRVAGGASIAAKNSSERRLPD